MSCYTLCWDGWNNGYACVVTDRSTYLHLSIIDISIIDTYNLPTHYSSFRSSRASIAQSPSRSVSHSSNTSTHPLAHSTYSLPTNFSLLDFSLHAHMVNQVQNVVKDFASMIAGRSHAAAAAGGRENVHAHSPMGDDFVSFPFCSFITLGWISKGRNKRPIL